jgi:hypothetical protein
VPRRREPRLHQIGKIHSGRESSIVDPMRLADWPMAYIGDMVPLAL